MFIRDFIHCEAPASVVKQQLLSDDGRWLVPLAGEAYREGQQLLVRVGMASAMPFPSKRVSLAFDNPYSRGDGLILPLYWRATGVPGLFPSLDADLEVAPLGPRTTQLTLQGSYEPPLGPVETALDTLLLHRVAEASARSFLRRIGEQLRTRDGALC